MCSQGALLSSPLNFTKLGTHQSAGKETKSNSAGYGFWYNVELPISTAYLIFIALARSSYNLAGSASHLPIVDPCATEVRRCSIGSSCTIICTELISARKNEF